MKKLRVAVIYGGRSGEHEISLQSAASVIRNLNPDRFEVVPVGIDKEGRWHLNDVKLIQAGSKSLPIFKDAPEVVLPPHPQALSTGLISMGSGKPSQVDVVFPVMHGPLCEDGSIQGLLELAQVPYVGMGVLGSAIGMDKEVAKRLAHERGLPVVPYVSLRKKDWLHSKAECEKRVWAELQTPVFVKPTNLGSSLGAHKVKTKSELTAAIDDAFQYDTKVLVEKAISAREIELSALEDSKAPHGVFISVPGEIEPTHEFYSYEAKYIDEQGAKLIIPAQLSKQQVEECQNLARRVFIALEGESMARVDLFLDKETGKIYFNEVNTIPGFTVISMYPKLLEASGISYSELLTRLVDLALVRHAERSALKREK